MVLPRGLKTFFQQTQSGRLTKGSYKGYRAVDAHGAFEGRTLRGITKLLANHLYSEGTLPDTSTSSTEYKASAWRGVTGGLKRGRAVDAQVSRLAGASNALRNNASKFKLSRIAFGALEVAGIEPICGQRVVVDKRRTIATACDIIGFRKSDNSIVVVELKCGFSGTRTLPALLNNKQQKMSKPCAGADDCILNRHLAQLTVTAALLKNEASLVQNMRTKFGITKINAALLYACDRDSQLHDLPPWWEKRSDALLDRIAGR